MAFLSIEAEVLIAGAGPAGLTLAAELTRHNIPPQLLSTGNLPQRTHPDHPQVQMAWKTSLLSCGRCMRPFDRLSFTLVDMVAEGDRVAVRWRMNGAHCGTWAGISLTSNAIELYANVIYELRACKVAAWPQVDCLGLLQQLRAFPADHFRPHSAGLEAVR